MNENDVNIMKLHSRGRPVITCQMFNNKTPAGYEHQTESGYFVSEDGNEIRIRIAKFGIRKFSSLDGYEIGSRARGNGWKCSLDELNKARGN